MNDSPDRREPYTNALVWALLLSITIFAAWVRWSQIRESLWLDECHTAWVATGPLQEVHTRAWLGNQNPTYFYLTWIACRLGPPDEVTVRSLSFMAGLALVPLVFWVVYDWTQSAVAAALASLLTALDHHCIFYAQEARPYSWVQWLGLLHVYLCAVVYRQPRWRWRCMLVIVSLLLLHLHITSVLLFVGETLWFAVVARSRPGTECYRFQDWLLDLGVAAIFTLPAWPAWWDLWGRRQDWAAFVPQRPLWEVAELVPVVPYVLVPLVLWLIANRLPSARRRVRTSEDSVWANPGILVAVAFGAPVLVAWLLTAGDVARLLFPRYLAAALVLPIVLGAYLVGRTPGGWVRVVAAAITLAACLATSPTLHQFLHDGRFLTDRKEDWRRAAALVRADPDQDVPVFVRTGLLEADRLLSEQDPLLRNYCLCPVLGIYRLDDSRRRLEPLPNRDAGRLADWQKRLIVLQQGAFFLINGSEATRQEVTRQLRQSLTSIPDVEWKITERRCGRVLVWRVQPTSPRSSTDP